MTFGLVQQQAQLALGGGNQPHRESGSVRLFGRDVTRDPEHRRTALGMGSTFQITNLFADLTLEENLALAILGTDRRKWVLHRSVAAFAQVRSQARESLAAVGLADRADWPVRRVSYGERRQLELGLALNTRPRVLFLDEPCAGLSPAERQRMSRMIADLPRDITLVMIEHDMDVALGLADRFTVLHQGRVILEGTPDEVRANAEVRDVYFGHGEGDPHGDRPLDGHPGIDPAASSRSRGTDTIRSSRHRQGRLHLRLPDGGQLPHSVHLLR